MSKKLANMTKSELVDIISKIEDALETSSGEIPGHSDNGNVLERFFDYQANIEKGNKELKDNLRLLENSLDNYADLFDYAPVGYLTLDKNGVIKEVNQTVSSMLGFFKKNLIGLPFTIFIKKNDAPRFIKNFKKSDANGNKDWFELQLKIKDNEIYARLLIKKIINYSDNTINYRVILIDISERVKSEKDIKESYEREKLARQASEKNEIKLRFIVEAATILNSSLDYNITLKAVAELSTPLIADWCTIDMLDINGKVKHIAVSHVNPEKLSIIHELNDNYSPNENKQSEIWDIIRNGKPALFKEVSQDMIRRWVKNEEHLKMVLELGFASCMIVPLKIRYSILGIITFVYGSSNKRYDEDDLSFAEELAGRIALALDNARLYKESSQLNLKLEKQVNVLQFEIEERKKAKKELTESEEKFRQLAENIKSVFFIRDVAEDKIIYLSPAFEELWGKDSQEVYDDPSKWMSIIHPDDKLRIVNSMAHSEYTENSEEFRIIMPDGDERWIYTKTFPVKDESGETYRVVGISEDITLRKNNEEQIKNSLKEKEVLLREIHHRVKNNLQIISSLLSLQSTYIKNSEDLDIFLDSQNRVKSMALVHEKLYQRKDLSGININDYVKDLINNLRTFYKAEQIEITIAVEDILLNIDLAIGLGLIINELISNSFKHAFPDNREGELTIIIKCENSSLTVIIADNGIGFPDHLDFKNTKSLGLQLVNTLTDQHSGDIQLDNKNGTKFTILFPNFNRC